MGVHRGADDRKCRAPRRSYDVLVHPGLHVDLPVGAEGTDGNGRSYMATEKGYEVLFVCVHNAGRSQMARALFNDRAAHCGLPCRAESAGAEPAAAVYTIVAVAMREVGLEMAYARPQVLTNEMVAAARRVFTMGCAVDAGVCPSVSLKRVDDWALPDPRGKPIGEVRIIRDDIRRRVEKLIGEFEQKADKS